MRSVLLIILRSIQVMKSFHSNLASHPGHRFRGLIQLVHSSLEHLIRESVFVEVNVLFQLYDASSGASSFSLPARQGYELPSDWKITCTQDYNTQQSNGQRCLPR